MSQELIDRITAMAKHVAGQGSLWPAWSTGEVLMVAIVLNRHDMLGTEGYTMAEAFDRVDLTVAQLLAIERAVQ